MRNVAAFVRRWRSSVPEMFSTPIAFLDFVVRNVFVLFLEVDHHVERNHGDADVGLVFLENLLRLVRTVERLTVGVFARTGMIATHDEVRAAMVLADDRVPNSLARSAHAHRERQQ